MLTQRAVYQARLWLASNLSWPSHIRPTDASIKLTENCQARCTTCDYWKHRSQDEIDTAAAVRLIRRLGELGVTTLRFTGGEPLLPRDFFDILGAIDPMPFSTISIQTKGLLLHRLAGEINASPITHVSVSLDAVGQRNDVMRGVRGYFARAIRRLGALQGKTRIIATTLTQVGAEDLDSLITPVQDFDGYLACNLPDDRLYFLQGADLDDLWPDGRTSDRIVETLGRRLRADFKDYELDYIRRYLHQARPGTAAVNPPARSPTPRSTSHPMGACDRAAMSCRPSEIVGRRTSVTSFSLTSIAGEPQRC